MNYLHVPNEISLDDIYDNAHSLSPAMYQRITIPNPSKKAVRDLLDPGNPYDLGEEPGSSWYLRRSPNYMIRTKALQRDTCLISPKGSSIVPINPRVFVNPSLKDGDILMSKDSNVGECATVDGHHWNRHMFSSGIVRLNPASNRYYLFAFLKHPMFKAQLLTRSARGATIRHAKKLWLDCMIPFPNQKDTNRVIYYVSVLTQAIIDKEIQIRSKNRRIDDSIDKELRANQKTSTLATYRPPSIEDLQKLGRLDAAMYTDEFKVKQFPIENYSHGFGNYRDFGLRVERGQNLQVSCIGRSIYSEEPKINFYRLVAPTDISEYRTVKRFRYLGNKRSLSLLQKGDVVFGAEGFHKGRVVILVDDVSKTITNIHGIVFHPKDKDMTKSVFFGCFLGYLRSLGVLDIIAAGGAGGSLAVNYFEHVLVSKFPHAKQKDIALLYHNPVKPPTTTLTLQNFLSWHRQWNEELGIWELDREMKKLQEILRNVQDQIIQGNNVRVPV